MNAPRGGQSGPNAANNSLRPRAVRPTPLRVPVAAPVSNSLTPRRVGSSPRLPVAADAPQRPWVRTFKGALLVAIAAGSAFGVVKIRDVVEQSDRFPLRAVVVEAAAGADAIADSRVAEVRAYAELDDGIPWFGIDTDAVARRVERHPFVREAVVQRQPPDGINITVSMRAPLALLRVDEALYLVDDDGEVMKRVRPGDPLDLPLISLDAVVTTDDSAASTLFEASNLEEVTNQGRRLRGLADAVDILASARNNGLLTRISEVVAIPAVGFELVLDDGARARVGTNDVDTKLRRLLSTEQTLKSKGQTFSFMWLDDGQRPERVAVRLRPATETSPAGG